MAAGYERFEVTWRQNEFDGAARARWKVASFGIRGVNFWAYKPESNSAALSLADDALMEPDDPAGTRGAHTNDHGVHSGAGTSQRVR